MVNKANDFFNLSNWEDIVNQNYEANKVLVDNQYVAMMHYWNIGDPYEAGFFYARNLMLLAQGCMLDCPEWPY